MIRELLAEAGSKVGGKGISVDAVAPSQTVTTPETYLGAARAERFTNPMLSPGAHDFSGTVRRCPSTNSPTAAAGGSGSTRRRRRPALRSSSTSAPAASTSSSAPRARAARMRVLLDGKPIAAADAGNDVDGGVVTITAQRLYNLVDLPRGRATHVLTLEPGRGGRGLRLHLRLGRLSEGAQQPSWRAITICCTSSVPSPIVRILASR